MERANRRIIERAAKHTIERTEERRTKGRKDERSNNNHRRSSFDVRCSLAPLLPNERRRKGSERCSGGADLLLPAFDFIRGHRQLVPLYYLRTIVAPSTRRLLLRAAWLRCVHPFYTVNAAVS